MPQADEGRYVGGLFGSGGGCVESEGGGCVSVGSSFGAIVSTTGGASVLVCTGTGTTSVVVGPSVRGIG